METFDRAFPVIAWVTHVLEYFAVCLIAFSFLHAMVRALRQLLQKRKDVWENLRLYMGKALQLALEFLVAADIIRTVLIEPTREGIISLGLLIVVRTLLIWSITVEIEGCWPWEVAKNKKG